LGVTLEALESSPGADSGGVVGPFEAQVAATAAAGSPTNADATQLAEHERQVLDALRQMPRADRMAATAFVLGLAASGSFHAAKAAMDLEAHARQAEQNAAQAKRQERA
jgi:hypothetical protein